MNNREAAWGLLTEFTQSESLRKHALAVEACMRAYANKLGGEEGLWGVVGLLHDFDYERYPSLDDHPYKGSEILKQRGYSDEIRKAIMSHAEYTGVPRDTPMEKALFACDELAGFITARRTGQTRQIFGRGGRPIRPQKNEGQSLCPQCEPQRHNQRRGGTGRGTGTTHRLLHTGNERHRCRTGPGRARGASCVTMELVPTLPQTSPFAVSENRLRPLAQLQVPPLRRPTPALLESSVSSKALRRNSGSRSLLCIAFDRLLLQCSIRS
jgi:putative nucleotidyltransferase with HDIG domain